MTTADHLLAKYPIISDQVSKDEVRLVVNELEHVLERQVEGGIVELGCYIGTTSLFIARLLSRTAGAPHREFHVYDSFAGLPDKQQADRSVAGEAFRAGQLAVSKSQFVREFRHAGLPLPIIHKAWFDHLTDADLPERIAFAFLDGDFYGSILASLKLVWPRMTPGSRILVDDYGREALPGVERAVQDFFRSKAITPALHVAHDIAIIQLEQAAHHHRNEIKKSR